MTGGRGGNGGWAVECSDGAVLGEIPAASAGMTVVGVRGYDGVWVRGYGGGGERGYDGVGVRGYGGWVSGGCLRRGRA